MTLEVDLLSAEVVRNPHPLFHRLRAEAPVHWSERHRGWLLTRYDDVAFAFRDARLSADRMTPMFERLAPEARAAVELAERHLTRWLVFMDPPGHDRLRRLVSRAFTPPRMEEMRMTVRAIVHDLLDAWPRGGVVPFIERFAYPLPTAVVAAVLGVPREDRDRFQRWSADVAGVVFGTGADPTRFERAQRGLAEFDSYIRALADDVRASRGRQQGLVADLVAVHDQGDRLSTDELVATCTLLLFAGHETTTSLLGNMMVVLHDAPGERARVASDRSLVPSAVEEVLRLAGSARAMVRETTGELPLPSGAVLPVGQRVFLLIAAANRDPQRFSEPDAVDVSRRDNIHLGFGTGIHHCLGAPLARVEAQESLAAILDRYPMYELDGEPVWGGGLLGYAASPVRVVTS